MSNSASSKSPFHRQEDDAQAIQDAVSHYRVIFSREEVRFLTEQNHSLLRNETRWRGNLLFPGYGNYRVEEYGRAYFWAISFSGMILIDFGAYQQMQRNRMRYRKSSRLIDTGYEAKKNRYMQSYRTFSGASILVVAVYFLNILDASFNVDISGGPGWKRQSASEILDHGMMNKQREMTFSWVYRF